MMEWWEHTGTVSRSEVVEQTFHFAPASIRFLLPAAVASSCIRYLREFCSEGGTPAELWTIEVVISAKLLGRVLTAVDVPTARLRTFRPAAQWHLRYETSGGPVLLADHWPRSAVLVGPRRVVLLTADETALEPRYLMYIARELLLGAAARSGLPMLHASAVVLDGTAVAFLGHKGAGKSTTLCALASSGAQVLANDRVFLERGNGLPRLRDFPMIFRLGSGTLGPHPALKRRVVLDYERRRPEKASTLRRGIRPERKYSITPQQFVESAGTRLVSQARLDLFIVLESSPDEAPVQARPLPPRELASCLRAHCLTLAEDLYLDAWLVDRAVDQDKLLSLLREASEQVPGLAVRAGLYLTPEDRARQLRALIAHAPPLADAMRG
jgi:hypothetical protein